ncbi:MAG: hypothetical protein KDA89_23865 [Planctomycetaceae bacterium]|nr:hypothetical protein [Planctomycetaceae bacterium]
MTSVFRMISCWAIVVFCCADVTFLQSASGDEGSAGTMSKLSRFVRTQDSDSVCLKVVRTARLEQDMEMYTRVSRAFAANGFVLTKTDDGVPSVVMESQIPADGNATKVRCRMKVLDRSQREVAVFFILNGELSAIGEEPPGIADARGAAGNL